MLYLGGIYLPKLFFVSSLCNYRMPQLEFQRRAEEISMKINFVNAFINQLLLLKTITNSYRSASEHWGLA